MAKIIDPTDLERNNNVLIDPTVNPPKVGLLIASGLTTDGVSVQALYSFLKEQWKTETDLIKYPFPMVAITPEQFEFVDNWVPSGSATIELFRDAGFAVATGGTSNAEYIGVITLGDVADAQVYYSQVDSVTAATNNFVLTGAVNQCVQVYGDADNGNFDYRDFFKVYARELARIYDDANNTDIGVSTFTYQAYRFPLANSDDLKVTSADVDADNSGVTITYYTTGQAFNIDGADSYYDVVIDGNSIPKQNIYEAVQSFLRKSTDIDAGAGVVSGLTADLLLTYVGDTLVTQPGVFINNILSVDQNAIDFYDTGSTLHQYPYVAAGTIFFNDNLQDDSGAIYKMFFTNDDAGDNAGNDFGTAGAIIVEDNSSIQITGTVVGASVAFDYDYNNNVQRGATSTGTTAPVTVVAIGLDKAQYVKTTGTITQSKVITISLVAALERNYTNPA